MKDIHNAYDEDSKNAGWDSPNRAQKLIEPFVIPEVIILDIGIGTGQSIRGYSSKRVNIVGIDHDPKMLEAAKLVAGDSASLRLGDINKPLPLDDLRGRVSVAQAIGILEFAEDLSGIFEQVRDGLQDDGIFVFTIELREDTGVQAYERTHFPESDITVYRHTTEEIQTLLGIADYKLLSKTTYDGYKRGKVTVQYAIFLVQKA